MTARLSGKRSPAAKRRPPPAGRLRRHRLRQEDAGIDGNIALLVKKDRIQIDLLDLRIAVNEAGDLVQQPFQSGQIDVLPR